MRNLIAVALLGLTLAGCAHMPDGTTVFLPTVSVKSPATPMSMYDIKATYAIAQAGGDAYVQRYRDGFRCTKTKLESVTNLCSRRSIVERIRAADAKAQEAMGKADAFIRDNPTLDASSVISAAQTAVDLYYSIQKGNP